MAQERPRLLLEEKLSSVSETDVVCGISCRLDLTPGEFATL